MFFCSCFFFLGQVLLKVRSAQWLSPHVSCQRLFFSFFSKKKRSKDFYCLFVFESVVVPNSSTEVLKKKKKKKRTSQRLYDISDLLKSSDFILCVNSKKSQFTRAISNSGSHPLHVLAIRHVFALSDLRFPFFPPEDFICKGESSGSQRKMCKSRCVREGG